MPMHYVAVIEKEPDSAFGVWLPDVEGCFSAGDTVKRQSRMLRWRCVNMWRLSRAQADEFPRHVP